MEAGFGLGRVDGRGGGMLSSPRILAKRFITLEAFGTAQQNTPCPHSTQFVPKIMDAVQNERALIHDIGVGLLGGNFVLNNGGNPAARGTTPVSSEFGIPLEF